MGRVVHFEITADDPKRAAKFYSELFDWKMNDSGMPNMDYTLVTTGDEKDMGIDGAIMPRTYRQQPVINTIAVDDLKDILEKVKAAGGESVGDVQDIPGIGKFSYIKDTEGNLVGLLQPLPRQGK